MNPAQHLIVTPSDLKRIAVVCINMLVKSLVITENDFQVLNILAMGKNGVIRFVVTYNFTKEATK